MMSYEEYCRLHDRIEAMRTDPAADKEEINRLLRKALDDDYEWDDTFKERNAAGTAVNNAK